MTDKGMLRNLLRPVFHFHLLFVATVGSSACNLAHAQAQAQAHAQTQAQDVPVSRTSESTPVRIKDLVEFRGVRPNQLVGFGLVVGLPGTGDSKQSLATNRATANLLTRLGSTVKLNEVTTRNIAAVIVTADLPAFARIGDRLDVRISSIGDAASLEGGSLILTPMQGADEQTYAVAQGATSQGTGMAGAQGGSGGSQGRSSAPKTVALAKGATVEREFETAFVHNGFLELSLRNADFTTASRIVKAVNDTFNEIIADAQNAGLVKVRLPTTAHKNPSFTPVAFVSALEQVKVEPDSRALVVINERTGTVIAGANVVVSPVAISHGSLQIVIEDQATMVGQLPPITTVGELVSALNTLGAGPRDLVAILQALEAAKALKAELRLM